MCLHVLKREQVCRRDGENWGGKVTVLIDEPGGFFDGRSGEGGCYQRGGGS